ncbi:rhodanese-like domain-containing protein [Thalassovita aquimarina]|uniref:Rhodanese-like domain-containing protein n=1 Tax=Thalassovita aquimarina TaxID=2785917 RepID=A0ABS5HT17_9RHOB|nr:rhodanese-like domain-containing protein [Thalassovita aquimarina]MBR9652080.1 rhodanese-like domain-containing protein [Thalassovita aquimarina]
MIDRRGFVLALGAFCAVPVMGHAEQGILTPKEALDGIKAGNLLLVDIRTPEEWQQTGVAEGAWPIDMRRKDFGPILLALLERNPSHRVAVICRTGNRSGYLVDVLRKNGINDVLDVPEGMVGGRNGQGWIKAGLPIVSARDALSGIPSDLTVD